MVAIKPIQVSVCTQSSVWANMCKIVATKPSAVQIKKAKKRSERFKKVYKK